MTVKNPCMNIEKHVIYIVYPCHRIIQSRLFCNQRNKFLWRYILINILLIMSYLLQPSLFIICLIFLQQVLLILAQNSCNVFNEYQCSNKSCIPISKKCDGLVDCDDGSDETIQSCKDITCPKRHFHCAYGACVPLGSLCNGIKDCADNSDEVQCPMFDFTDFCVQTSSSEENVDQISPNWMVPCLSGECIPLEYKCDGIKHCSDNSDEIYNTCQSNTCQSGTFQCDYGACLPDNVTCNGISDCIDDSDELLDRCTSASKNKTSNICGEKFQCASNLCIDSNLVCNGKRDCDDGSDETIQNCKNVSCDGFRCKYGGCVNLDDLLRDESNSLKAVCVDSSDLLGTGHYGKGKNSPSVPKGLCSENFENCICNLPPQPLNGYYRATSVLNNNIVPPETTLEYYCNEHFLLGSEKNVVCLKNGTWSKSFPKCLPTCPGVQAENLNVTCTKNNISISCDERLPDGTTILVKCNYGYEEKNAIISKRVLTCNNGFWDNDPPDCTLVCGVAKPIGERIISEETITYQGDYPWHLGLYKNDSDNTDNTLEQQCSATLITPQYAISAAHCVYDGTTRHVRDVVNYIIAAGIIYRTINVTRDKHSQFREILRFVIPDSYRGRANLFDGDISIITLKEPLEMNQFVRPACIDISGTINDGNIVGWNITYDGFEDLAISTTIRNVEKEICFFQIPESFIKYTVFKLCGKYAGKSFCRGNSGAGWSTRRGSYHFIQGILVLSPPSETPLNSCDFQKPVIFTNIHYHLDWLQKNIPIDIFHHEKYKNKNTLIRPSKRNCVLENPPNNGKYKLNDRTSIKMGDIAPAFSVLEFKCNKGFTIDDNNPIVCVNGRWSRAYPKCQKTCPPLKSVTTIIKCQLNNTEVPCSKAMLPNTIASFRCKDGYDIQPPPTYRSSKCFNGVWDYPLYTCFPVCGIKVPEGQKFIIGGNDTSMGDFPWHVGLYQALISDVYHQICGGTIISPHLVITAAHCFIFSKDPEVYNIAAGKYYRQWKHPMDKKAQYRQVHKIIIPDRYQEADNSFAYDIAVIILKTTFVLSHLVRPVCMDWNNQYDDYQLSQGATGYVAGWGLTTENGNSSEVLKTIELPYISFRECYDNSPKDFRPFITNDKFCAGYLTGHAVCEGDSGGGLAFVKDYSIYYLRGVVSVGPRKENSCDANRYTAFTRVSAHIDWIISVDNEHRVFH